LQGGEFKAAPSGPRSNVSFTRGNRSIPPGIPAPTEIYSNWRKTAQIAPGLTHFGAAPHDASILAL